MRRTVLLLIACSFLPSSAFATWSVIAVDQATGRVVIASATCVDRDDQFLMGVQAVVVPGKGVAACQAAVEAGTDLLEDAAMRRGLKGVRQPVYHAGKRVGYIVRYSDRLLLALLRARRPRKYRDSGSRHDNDDASGLAARLAAARKRIAS